MTTREIEALLEKYFEGNTTLQEENILRVFFRSSDVPDHLKSYQEMFGYIAEQRVEQLNNPVFEHKLSELLVDEPAKILEISALSHRNRFVYITGIAATILLMVGLFFTYNQDVFKGEKSNHLNANQELAYAEASEALMIVSANLNAGLKQVDRLQMVDKAMKNVQLLNRFYQYQSIIINPDEIQQKSINSK